MTTLTEAQTRLQEYMDAESACLLGQETRVTSANGIDRTSVMADLATIRRGLAFWRGEVARLQRDAAGAPSFGGVGFAVANFSGDTSGGCR